MTSQIPSASDYRRAALLFVHRQSRNAAKFNAVLAEADQLSRFSMLVLCVVNLAQMSDPTLATREGVTRLEDVAIEFGRREGLNPDDLLGDDDEGGELPRGGCDLGGSSNG